MTEGERCALFDVGFNIFAVDFGLPLIRRQHHDHIRALYGVGGCDTVETVCFDFLIGRRGRFQTDDDVHAAIFQVQRMGAALTAIAEHGDAFALDNVDIAIGVVENFDVTHGKSVLLE